MCTLQQTRVPLLLPPPSTYTTSQPPPAGYESPRFTQARRVIKQCRTVVHTSATLGLTMYTLLLSSSPQTTVYPARDNTVNIDGWVAQW